MRKIHECAEDIKNILNDAERTEEVDGGGSLHIAAPAYFVLKLIYAKISVTPIVKIPDTTFVLGFPTYIFHFFGNI